tara:strand:+ start:435 stop:1091 length:657 start_codon:yes stop_codon:yes gene_type:complete
MIDTSKTYKSNNFGDFKIVNYVNKKNIEIEFVNTGARRIVREAAIKIGAVRDLFVPTSCGIGFLGEGRHNPTENGKRTKAHNSWSRILSRCYREAYHKEKPTYKNCTVCEEWHNFQNYAEWYEANYIEGYHLDKDIKQRGVVNKIYSPETCLFVTPKENVIEALAKNYTFISPCDEVTNIYNITKYCRDNNLNAHMMLKVNDGINKSHRGWTRYVNNQ